LKGCADSCSAGKSISAQLDERTLQEIYTLPFALAVKEGQVAVAMGAYNKINGGYSCENPHLLKR
jgi:beta-glucosidase